MTNKLTRSIVEARMPIEQADALFGGQVSAWVQGEPIPRKYKSRLEKLFCGWEFDKEPPPPTPSAPIKEGAIEDFQEEEEPTRHIKSTKRRK